MKSIWVLYKSFFDAVPGQKGLLVIGFLLMALGYFQQGSIHAEKFIFSGIVFVAGFTLIFAGPHFRQLASFRKHRLLPNFRLHLIISYLISLFSLSFLVLAGVKLSNNKYIVHLLQEEGLSTVTIWLSIFSAILITSFLSFIPKWYVRYPLWLFIIFGATNNQIVSAVPVELLLRSTITIAILGLGCFLYLVVVDKKSTFYTKETISLSKYLPGLNGSFQEPGVTAIGSIFLGISDGNISRFIRSFVIAVVLPIALACSTLLTNRYSIEQFFTTPLFLFMAMLMGAVIQLHFASTVSARKRFVWLRIGNSRQQIDQAALKVLARERRFVVLCYGLWCIPVMTLFPETAVWILGVSTLLWSIVLLLEQVILSLKGQPTRRFEFYMLLLFFGILVSIIALTQILRQPWILWFGVVVILGPYSAIKLTLKESARTDAAPA